MMMGDGDDDKYDDDDDDYTNIRQTDSTLRVQCTHLSIRTLACSMTGCTPHRVKCVPIIIAIITIHISTSTSISTITTTTITIATST